MQSVGELPTLRLPRLAGILSLVALPTSDALDGAADPSTITLSMGLRTTPLP